MARESSRCPNCKTPIRDSSDYCEKCGMRLYFKCEKCGEKWFRTEGTLCPYCEGRSTTDYVMKNKIKN